MAAGRSALPSGRDLTGWRTVFLLGVVLAHCVLVASIISQPLEPHVPPIAPRSVLWWLQLDARTAPGPGADFFALYHAGVQSGRGVSPYATAEHPPATPFYFRYLYAPVLAHTLGRLVASLPAREAYVAWACVIEASLFLFAWTCWRQWRGTWLSELAPGILLLNAPFFLELHVGQFTFVATALATTGLVWSARAARSAMLAASLVAAGGVLKVFPIFALGALRGNGTAPALYGGLVAAGVLGVGTWLYPNETASFVWLNSVDDSATAHLGLMNVPHTIRVALEMSGHLRNLEAWSTVPATLLVTSAVSATLFVRRYRVDPVSGFSLVLLVFLLTFYRTAEHHYSAVILLGVALMTRTGHLLDVGTRRLAIACLVILAMPISFLLVEASAHPPDAWVRLLVPLAKIVPALGLVSLAVPALRASGLHRAPR